MPRSVLVVLPAVLMLALVAGCTAGPRSDATSPHADTGRTDPLAQLAWLSGGWEGPAEGGGAV
jgi:hypothetical protein